jgi:hypothetical protein
LRLLERRETTNIFVYKLELKTHSLIEIALKFLQLLAKKRMKAQESKNERKVDWEL